MRFCDKCNNMYYIRISGNADSEISDEGDTLVHYCRNCGNNETSTIDTICVSKTQVKRSEQTFMNNINEFTKLDPTLPRIDNIPCPNKECPSNKDKQDERKVIYVRYDDTQLKFIYLCVHCDRTWKTS